MSFKCLNGRTLMRRVMRCQLGMPACHRALKEPRCWLSQNAGLAYLHGTAETWVSARCTQNAVPSWLVAHSRLLPNTASQFPATLSCITYLHVQLLASKLLCCHAKV